ncbi:helix-turn-helix domain-containing protein, partial [Anaerotignum sp.]|uniref:helix-turn-helix domain-containing protein n=1 Tax=Anaerotignum sp. TaxID=2039241 RepID=UPI003A84A82F
MRDSEKTNCHHKGSNSMSQKNKLNVEEKAEIIRKYQQGEISLSQAARYAEVGLTTIYRWSARYEAEGV